MELQSERMCYGAAQIIQPHVAFDIEEAGDASVSSDDDVATLLLLVAMKPPAGRTRRDQLMSCPSTINRRTVCGRSAVGAQHPAYVEFVLEFRLVFNVLGWHGCGTANFYSSGFLSLAALESRMYCSKAISSRSLSKYPSATTISPSLPEDLDWPSMPLHSHR